MIIQKRIKGAKTKLLTFELLDFIWLELHLF